MTAKAGASVRSQILEERIDCRDSGTAGLKGSVAPVGIVIDFKPRNDRRRRLGPLVDIFETAHLLRVVNGAGSPIGRLSRVDVANVLRQCARAA